MLMPHSIIKGDACFAYFNKIWGIPLDNETPLIVQPHRVLPLTPTLQFLEIESPRGIKGSFVRSCSDLLHPFSIRFHDRIPKPSLKGRIDL